VAISTKTIWPIVYLGGGLCHLFRVGYRLSWFISHQFLRFTGIPLASDPNTAAKAAEPTTQKGNDDDSESDMDMDEDDDPQGGIIDPKALASMGSSMKAQTRGEDFLRDPALLLKVFFSSYARERGIIWYVLYHS